MIHQSFAKPYKQLTPENCALVLIDHQQGLILTTQTMWLEQLKRNTPGLASLARVFKVPTLIASGKQKALAGPLFPELLQALPDAPVMERGAMNCFHDPKILDWIEKSGRRKLIFGGITTDVCITLTTIAAADAGYEAYYVTDVSTTWDRTSELGAMMRMSQRGVIMTNWQSVGAECQADWVKNAGTAKAFGEVLGTYNTASAAVAATIIANSGQRD